MWYSFRPGVIFWNVGFPIGSFYYSFPKKNPKPFLLAKNYARWVTGNPKENFIEITKEKFIELFNQGIEKFPDASFDCSDLSAFKERGGKLIIDHSLSDPLIPVDGTIDYYKKLVDSFGKESRVREFCKLYLTSGDGHGNCWSDGPGISESVGMIALVLA